MLDKTNWKKTESLPDLTKPSLEGLVYLLRHEELWPKGFEYYWGEHRCCAMGLAKRFWNINNDGTSRAMATEFNISQEVSSDFFLSDKPSYPSRRDPTAEEIANYIESWQKAQKSVARNFIWRLKDIFRNL